MHLCFLPEMRPRVKISSRKIAVVELQTLIFLNSRFVCAVIRTGLQIRKSVLILFLVVF